MRHSITEKLHELAANLDTLKTRVRLALADEMAKAVGAAVRDILIVALCERFAAVSTSSGSPYRSPGPSDWRREYERDAWDDDDSHVDYPRSTWREPAMSAAVPPIPTAAAVAVGVHIGRLCGFAVRVVCLCLLELALSPRSPVSQVVLPLVRYWLYSQLVWIS